ncbi:hypothetical protein ACFE04_020077 [Oxalis oulophora]
MDDPERLEQGLEDKNFVHEDRNINKDGLIELSRITDENCIDQDEEKEEISTIDEIQSLVKVFIGFIIVMMIILHAGEEYPKIAPSPWNGCTFADLIMPFYLFVVGFSTALGFKIIQKLRDSIFRVIAVALKLLLWGIFLQGGYLHEPNDLTYGIDMKFIRWCGLLQKIAVVYLVVALIEVLTNKQRPKILKPGYMSIFATYKCQWIGGLIASLIYFIITYALYVPDWNFVIYINGEPKKYTVRCGTRGELGPACNAGGYIDRAILGINHLYSDPAWRGLKACTDGYSPSWCHARFEPEGLLSTVTAILSGTIGVHYGHIFVHFKSHLDRLKLWVTVGFTLLIIGIILHTADVIPINRQLYSFSFVCFAAGIAGITFSGLYILICIFGWRTPFLFLEWIGMNEMLVFVFGAQNVLKRLMNGWYYSSPENKLVNWIQTHIFINVWNSERTGTLLYVISIEITFWGLLAGILHKLGIYWIL